MNFKGLFLNNIKSTLPEILIKFHKKSIFVLAFELLIFPLVIDDKISSFILQFGFQVVILRYFAYSLKIFFHNLTFFSHLRKCMSHLIKQIPEGNNSLIREMVPTISIMIVIHFYPTLLGLISPYPIVNIVVQAKYIEFRYFTKGDLSYICMLLTQFSSGSILEAKNRIMA